MNAKERFQKNHNAELWIKFITSMAFEEGSDAAMLTLMNQLNSRANEPGVAAANHFRLEGAELLLNTMVNLTRVETSEKPKSVGQLNHKI